MRIERREPIVFSTPAEAIAALSDKLGKFERAYGRKSSDFYASYREDIRVPDLNAEEWASTYELLLRYLRSVDLTLTSMGTGASLEAPVSSLTIGLALAA